MVCLIHRHTPSRQSPVGRAGGLECGSPDSGCCPLRSFESTYGFGDFPRPKALAVALAVNDFPVPGLPLEIVYRKEIGSRSDASKEELRIKRMVLKGKLALVNAFDCGEPTAHAANNLLSAAGP